ncbi:MAG: hypothetical protein ACI87T_001905, partial [Planctomycetota bacterium]
YSTSVAQIFLFRRDDANLKGPVGLRGVSRSSPVRGKTTQLGCSGPCWVSRLSDWFSRRCIVALASDTDLIWKAPGQFTRFPTGSFEGFMRLSSAYTRDGPADASLTGNGRS